MINKGKIRSCLIICIYSSSFLILSISIQESRFQESTDPLEKLIRSSGFAEKEIHKVIPRLTSMTSENISSKESLIKNTSHIWGIKPKIIDSTEDTIDNNASNVDYSADKGSHLNFGDQQIGPDAAYDTLTEENTSEVSQVDLEVYSWDIYRNKWSKTGGSPYLDNQTNPLNDVHVVEGTAGSKNGAEIGNFGFQDKNLTGTIISVKLRVYGHANPTYPEETYFSVHFRNGSSGIEIMNFSGESNFIWKEVDVTNYLDTWNKINVSKIFLRTEDNGSKSGELVCDIATLRVTYLPPPNYEMDVEVQWTSAEYTKPNAELAIYAGNLGVENLRVDVWNESSSSWLMLIPSLSANSWNNISVISFLTSSTFTIRFKGTIETSDTSQDQWEIDVTLLHTWDTDESPPVINDFGLDDPGSGMGIFWANITDSQSDVENVTLTVNSTEVIMVYNGTPTEPGYWIFEASEVPVEFNKTYSYRIANASDSAENYIPTPSEIKNYTFILDFVAPNVDNWEYFADFSYNGTFNANVSDNWGKIDAVILNITEVNGTPRNDLLAIMVNTTSGYMNDSTFLQKETTFKFVIIVNDTAGNSYTSLEHSGAGPNHPPEIFDPSITSSPRTNDSLQANWTFYDVDGDNESSGWIIRWYKNGIYQSNYDNFKSISSDETTKGDDWNYTVRVSDGADLSIQYSSPTITIINTPPEITDLTITVNLTSSDNLFASWTSYDIDGDNPDNHLNVTIIKWYNWTGSGWDLITSLTNVSIVESGNLTKNEVWRYTLQIFDGENYSNIYLSPNTTILNSPPVLMAIPSFNKTTDVTSSDTINITYSYTDTDGDEEDFNNRITYWYRNGTFYSSMTNETILLNTETSSGESWQYIIRIYDGFNYSQNYTSIIVQIDTSVNNIPEAQNLTITANTTNTTIENIIANYDYFDSDGLQNPVEEKILWYCDGILKPNLNNSLIVDSTLTSKNQIWNFTIRVFDGLNWSIQYSSSQLIIQNTIPQVTNLQFTSNTTTVNDLTVDWNFVDVDEGDSQEGYEIKWYINGNYNDSYYNFSIIPFTITKKGQGWNYSVQVSDGENYSLWYNSTITFILNSPPSIQNLNIQGGENTSQNITLTYEFFDHDNDTEDEGARIIQWFFVNGTMIPGQNGKELQSIYFAVGDILYAKIIPHDSEDSGNVFQSEYLTVGNALPEIVGIPTILGYNGSDIFFAATSLSINYSTKDLDSPKYVYDIEIDENGWVIGANYRWYKNDELISGLASPTVPSYYLSKGETWIASVQPRDRYGDYGAWVNSTPISIGNTPPEVVSFTWGTNSPTARNDLSFSYTYFDHDSDPEWMNQIEIHWYNNSVEISGTENQVVLSKLKFQKGDIINVSFSVFDGENYSSFYVSESIKVLNAIPEARNIAILPTKSYTYNPLVISYDFFDVDADEESSDWIIHWFWQGIWQENLNNYSVLSANYTSADDVWIAHLKIFDGTNYSITYISQPKIILNSPPRILEVSLSGDINESYADTSLSFTPNEDITFYDPDQDLIFGYSVFWVKNNTYQHIYEDQTEIPASELRKNDTWFIIVQIFDGKDWSGNQSSQEILIINKAPEIFNLQFIDNIYSEFIVENEDLRISYTFLDVDNDPDVSYIIWYRNQTQYPQYNGLKVIPANATSPGDIWLVEIQPFDNGLFGPSVNFTTVVESQPTINEWGIDIKTDTEGHYSYWVNVTDPRNPISEVTFQFLFSNTSIQQTKWAEQNGTVDYWVVDYQLEDYSYLGTLVTIKITAITSVEYSTSYEIANSSTSNHLIKDDVAPRVIDAYFERDNEINPTSLTFFAKTEEYGSGIAEVILNYYFKPDIEGTGANSDPWFMASMEFLARNTTENFEYWTVTVDFSHNRSDYEILYYIQTKDNSGNENLLAFDIRNFPQRINENKFIYNIQQGLPQWVLLIAVLIIFVIFIGSVVYIKFIRKPELVGLDKEVVMKNIKEINEQEVLNSLDLHTVGTVVSYFDQRSGPVPLIVVPDLLRDNIATLISLSDRAFNSCGFVDDFLSENYSSFDFSLETHLRINSMSYGYSIENPEARAGAENYTVNILIVPEIFPFINQFKEELQELVHEIHMLMTNEPTEKDKILNKVIELRQCVSYIVLSYKQKYGTTELLGEEA